MKRTDVIFDSPRSEGPGPPFRRGGFSLVELIVSIGLLGLMLSLAGKIFSLSIESTGQATSLINVSKSLRLLEESLRRDLCGVDPDRSMLIIQSNPINAYWTADGKVADDDGNPSTGYPHAGDPEREKVNGNLIRPRADMLMFFTSRVTSSAAYPGVRSDLAQVVYGHAELGELDSNGNWAAGPVPFPPDDVLFFDQPADGWHLARRATGVIDAPLAVLEAALEITVTPPPPNSPDEGLGPFPLRDGLIDFIVQPLGGVLFFDGKVINGTPWTNPALPRWYLRSRLDVTPPARSATRLGHYFLPKCASFKVEWTPIGPGRMPEQGGINLRQMLWIDPGVAAGGNPDDWTGKIRQIASTLDPNDADDAQLLSQLSDLESTLDTRFGGLATHEWFARDPSVGAGDASDPLWPTALRVTVDVYDDTGHFTRPVRHVMVIPVGNDL